MNRIITFISLLAAFLTIGDVTWKIISNQNYNIKAIIIVIIIIMLLQASVWLILDLGIDKKDSYIPYIIYTYIPIIIGSSIFRYYKLVNSNGVDIFQEAINLSILISVTVVLYIFWSTVFKTEFHKNRTLQGSVFGLSASSMVGLLIYIYIIQNRAVDNSLWGFVLLISVITFLSAIINISPIPNFLIRKKNIQLEETNKSLSEDKKKLTGIWNPPVNKSIESVEDIKKK